MGANYCFWPFAADCTRRQTAARRLGTLALKLEIHARFWRQMLSVLYDMKLSRFYQFFNKRYHFFQLITFDQVRNWGTIAHRPRPVHGITPFSNPVIQRRSSFSCIIVRPNPSYSYIDPKVLLKYSSRFFGIWIVKLLQILL